MLQYVQMFGMSAIFIALIIVASYAAHLKSKLSRSKEDRDHYRGEYRKWFDKWHEASLENVRIQEKDREFAKRNIELENAIAIMRPRPPVDYRAAIREIRDAESARIKADLAALQFHLRNAVQAAFLAENPCDEAGEPGMICTGPIDGIGTIYGQDGRQMEGQKRRDALRGIYEAGAISLATYHEALKSVEETHAE